MLLLTWWIRHSAVAQQRRSLAASQRAPCVLPCQSLPAATASYLNAGATLCRRESAAQQSLRIVSRSSKLHANRRHSTIHRRKSTNTLLTASSSTSRQNLKTPHSETPTNYAKRNIRSVVPPAGKPKARHQIRTLSRTRFSKPCPQLSPASHTRTALLGTGATLRTDGFSGARPSLQLVRLGLRHRPQRTAADCARQHHDAILS